MTKFMSPAANLMKSFITFRKACEKWCASYEVGLRLFDKHCSVNFPNAIGLTQQMVDGWCSKRDTETPKSNRQRCYVVRTFIKYLRERGLTKVLPPELPRATKSNYVPHAFTHDELSRFFFACDNISGVKTLEQRMRRITIPVFFRLLYSSGIRTTEGRMLRRKDVNLDNGLIDIQLSKGYDKHYVVLHDSMLELMRKFDMEMDRIIPNRTFFFPARKDGFHSEYWVYTNFRELWDSVNESYATAYELRHNYATVNINRWIGLGMNVETKKVYLSRSMGHSVFRSTEEYYHLVPALAQQLYNNTNSSFEEIIPDIPHENKETE